jgi:hypothetical protein
MESREHRSVVGPRWAPYIVAFVSAKNARELSRRCGRHGCRRRQQLDRIVRHLTPSTEHKIRYLPCFSIG